MIRQSGYREEGTCDMRVGYALTVHLYIQVQTILTNGRKWGWC